MAELNLAKSCELEFLYVQSPHVANRNHGKGQGSSPENSLPGFLCFQNYISFSYMHGCGCAKRWHLFSIFHPKWRATNLVSVIGNICIGMLAQSGTIDCTSVDP